MRTIGALLLASVIVISLTGGATAHVSLDYPVGGETFNAGETVEIQWHLVIPHEQENWDLHFSPDGGQTWENIRLNMPISQLSYQWTVPDLETDQARVRIIQDNVSTDYQDVSGDFTIHEASTSVQSAEDQRPLMFTLQANYPNPFNASTTIGYLLEERTDVRLTIYNTLGQVVRTLVKEYQPAGSHHIQWHGRDEAGLQVASGIYVYALQAGTQAEARKMVLMR
jgi:hypothetical protein